MEEEAEMSVSVPLIELSGLEDGQGRSVRLQDRTVAVFRQAERIYVVDDECPHVGASLANGWVEEGQVVCSFHGWKFDLQTGACLTCPGRPVRTYPVRIEAGMVHIEVEGL